MRHAAPLLLILSSVVALPAALHAAAPKESEPAGEGVALLVRALAEDHEPQFQLDVLKGMNAAMEGRRRVAAPPGWDKGRDRLLRSADPRVRAQAQSLAVIFGDAVAFDLMRKTLADRAADASERRL